MADAARPRVLLFTDVVDSTRLVERLGDDPARVLWTAHDRSARELLQRWRGREIDRSDGFFLLFDEIADAAQFALAYHAAAAGLDIAARIGIHVGPATLRENDSADVARGAKPIEVEGLAKPVAARVMTLARGGQTLLSAAARDALGAAVPPGCTTASHGHYRLKGLAEPIEIVELGRRDSAAFDPPDDSAKAYRVLRDGELWRPLREVHHNLPAERDAFVGRRAELHALAERLDGGARLLTVTGSGGTGKTRLARRYGRGWRGDWPGGVHFCDLSEARSLGDVLSAVAVALGVPPLKGDAAVQVGHALAARGRCLLILDNFEQVIEHAPATLGHWLDRAEEAAFLVTSRERLHLGGEVLLALDPLALATDAVALFTARATAQRSDFVLGPHNRAAVLEVVRLLDGLPLAIELAAARVRIFSPEQLLQRMADRFQLLAGARGGAARQATLKAAIDWSWELLSPWEQAALAQCSVFDGGFTIESAEAVLDLLPWAEAPPAMDVVHALLDKSLLRTWHVGPHDRQDIDEPYFGMYLSIHEYVRAKLDASGPQARLEAESRHGHHFAASGSDATIEALSLHGGVRQRLALALELDNLVAGCRRAVARGDGKAAVGTYRAAWEVLELRGPFVQGVTLGGPVIALPGLPPSLRAPALLTRAVAARRAGLADVAAQDLAAALDLCRVLRDRRREGLVLAEMGLLEHEQGRFESALKCLDTALQIHREVGHRRAEGVALSGLDVLYSEQGRSVLARTFAEQGLTIHRELGNRRLEGQALTHLAMLDKGSGRLDEAHAHCDAALAIHRELGNRVEEGLTLGNLAILYFDQGRHEQALACYRQALALTREVGYRRYEGIVLGNLSHLHQVCGRLDEALPCAEAALAIHREVGNRRSEGIMLSSLASLHVDRGRASQALALFDQSMAVHREVGNRRGLGGTLTSLGELLASLGRSGPAGDALREGESLLREVDDRLELAKLLCTRGRLDLARGDRDAALAALAEAQATASAIGAGPDALLGREITQLQQALE